MALFLKKLFFMCLTVLSSTLVYAEGEAASKTGGPNALGQLAPLAIIFIIFYFLMIRPQKKKLDEEKKMLDALKKGDEIYTKSGIIGVVHGLTDKLVTLEVATDTKIKVLRSQIGGMAKAIFEVPKTDSKEVSTKA